MTRAAAPDLETLRAELVRAREEFDMAVAFYEAWRPTAFDDDLRSRLGVSYATNTFRTVRVALRREALLALCRVWDRTRGGTDLGKMCQRLKHPRAIDMLMYARKATNRDDGLEELFKENMNATLAETFIVADACAVGAGGDTLSSLLELRHAALAHRTATKADGAALDDAAVEKLFQDTAKIIQGLMHVLELTAYDPLDATGVHRLYAEFFWASVLGERTPGHPRYKVPMTALS